MSVEENKALIRRMVEAIWIKHDLDAVADYVAGDQVEESTEHVGQFLTAFPDVRVDIEDLIAEGDKVVARLVVTGTHTGPFAGRPPTGQRVSFGSIRIYGIAAGKIVETWAMQDRLGLMQQLGILPSEDAGVEWAAGEDEDAG